MALTLAEANRMIQAAIAKAGELNVNVSIAVCDAGGNLLAFNRMEGASPVSATVAQGKAAQRYRCPGQGGCFSRFRTGQRHSAGGLTHYTGRHSQSGGSNASGTGRGARTQGW